MFRDELGLETNCYEYIKLSENTVFIIFYTSYIFMFI